MRSPRPRSRRTTAWGTLSLITLLGCGAANAPTTDVPAGALPKSPSSPSAAPSPPTPPGVTPQPSSGVSVHLVAAAGVSGVQRVNFGLPLARGWQRDPRSVRVKLHGVELPVARRVIARHKDGSIRSVQLQFDLDVTTPGDVEITFAAAVDAAGPPDLALVPVGSTLHQAVDASLPKVWAVLPAAWLTASGWAGHLSLRDADTGDLAAWNKVCDYHRFDDAAFVAAKREGSVWLYDRPTVFFRGYARSGDLTLLAAATREVDLYRAGLTGQGHRTAIGVPGKENDLKYFYTQGLALHYLLSGDERFREAAENVADRVSEMWSEPGYTDDTDFWTERNAGFALLDYVWASIVSDDRAAHFASLADAAVTAYASAQDRAVRNYTDTRDRCFAHSADAHGEDFGYVGCSPWMSAILADGLEVYADESVGPPADNARAAIVKLGRVLAHRRDKDGKPFYWMGIGTNQNEVDPDDEHWGESAYVVAMAWYYGGKTEADLKAAALELAHAMRARGSAPHMRSFNWQCRSAVATPFYLK